MLSQLFGRRTPTSESPIPNLPLERVDIGRYMGVWHEIAHLPSIFQRKCKRDVTATYTLQADGRVRVHNQCRKADGEMASAVGEARTVDWRDGALKVRFAPKFLSFLPMVWGDYWILDIDRNYQWALVGGPDCRYLWILSRTPEMASATFENLKERARHRGYDVSKLILMAPIIDETLSDETSSDEPQS